MLNFYVQNILLQFSLTEIFTTEKIVSKPRQLLFDDPVYHSETSMK